MQEALKLARIGASIGEVPVGAVLVVGHEIIGAGWNQPISSTDPTAHAEVVALRSSAANTGNYRLSESTLYVTLEPCPMCAGAIVLARVERVVFGAVALRTGAAGSVFNLLQSPHLNHRVEEIRGEVLADECGKLLRDFFQNRRLTTGVV